MTPSSVSLHVVTYFVNLSAKRIFQQNQFSLFIGAQVGSIHGIKNVEKSRDSRFMI